MFEQRPQENSSLSTWQHLFAVLVISALGIAIYANSVRVPFYFDDIANIVDNRNVHVTEWDVSKFVNAAVHGRSDGGNRRPLAYLSFALNYYFSGTQPGQALRPFQFHYVNIAIHVIASLLAYFLAFATFRLWSKSSRFPDARPEFPVFPAALFAACLFTAHPIQTQAVTYVVQRMTSMAAMFYLASLLLFVYGRQTPRRGARASLWSVAVVSAALALASKQIAVTLPLIALLYEWFFFRDLDRAWMKKAALRVLLPAFLVMLVLGLIYTSGNPIAQIQKGYKLRDFTMLERLYTQPRVVVFHLSQILYPSPSRMNLLHSFEHSRSLFDPITSLFSLLTLAALFAGAVKLARRQPIVSFGILWFLINLVLESSILALEMSYEHRMYLPLFGLVLAAAYWLFRLPSRFVAYGLVAAVLVTVLCAQATVKRNEAWHNRLEFWHDLVAKTDASLQAAETAEGPPRRNRHASRIYNNYGQVLAAKGNVEKARIQFIRSIELDETYAPPHYNMGIAHAGAQENDEAFKEFTKAVKHSPEWGEAFVQRARLHRSLNQFPEAIDDYSSALKHYPDYSQASFERAQCYMKLGKFDLALADLNETVRLQPKEHEPYDVRGRCLQKMGRIDEARRDYETAQRLRKERNTRGRKRMVDAPEK